MANPPLGLYTQYNTVSAITSLASSLGVTVTGYEVYCAGDSYSSIAQGGANGTFGTPPAGKTLLLGVPMCPSGSGISTVAGNLGSFRTLAGIVPNGSIMRIGWEFDDFAGPYTFPWGVPASAGNTGAPASNAGNSPSTYATAFQQIVTAMRGVNDTLLFDFCCNTSSSTLAVLETYYPGDAYVDFIGGDHYDYASGERPLGGDQLVFGPPIQLAVARGKPLSIAEWGLNGVDDPLFINNMAQVILDPAAAIAEGGTLYTSPALPLYTVGYHCYFSDPDYHSNLGPGSPYPNATAAFSSDFAGGSSPTVPTAPTIGTASAGNAQATVTWTAPSSTGGDVITNYIITSYIGSTAETNTTVGNVLTGTVTGLTNGTAYTFKVAAVNAVGTGPQSAASNAVTPTGGTTPGAITIAQLSPATSPPGRIGQGQCYHPTKQLIYVSTGATDTAAVSDTWSFNGTTWTQITTANNPGEITDMRMAYDPVSGNIIGFGGYNGSVSNANTWSFNGTNWTQLTPATSPPLRSEHVMFNDPITNHVCIYGGNNASATYYDDMWTWNGTTWSETVSAVTGTGRSACGAQTLSFNSTTVLYGGYTASTTLSDTWVWNGSSWSEKSPTTVPPASCYMDMCYLGTGPDVAMYGGRNASSTIIGTLYTWNGTNWTLVSPGGVTIGPMELQRMTWFPPQNVGVFFGGTPDDENVENTTFTLNQVASGSTGRFFFSLA